MTMKALMAATIGGAAVATAAVAQVPPDLAARIAAMGRGIEPVKMAELYAPLQARAPAKGMTVRRDVAYGDDAKETFDLFTMGAPAGKKRPVLIFVHGGGFRADDKRGLSSGSPFYDNVLLWAAGHDMVGINMNYPLAPGATYPTVQKGVATVVAWARAHAKEVGGDPDRIILWGHSAGAAHVATYLAHPETYRDVAGAQQPVAAGVLFAGLYDMAGETKDNIYFGPVAGLRERSSVEGLVRSGVPLFLEVAEYDPPFMVDQYDRLGAALKRAGRIYTPLMAKAHNHMSEIYSVNTDDVSITGPLLRFLSSAPSRPARR